MSGAGCPREGRRKVLFITFDQWRGDAIAALGAPGVVTPTLDALLSRATSFARHYSCAAPCGPSRATLLTGRYPMNHRSVRNGAPLDARFSNLALEARALGVEPVLIGYTDTSVDPRERSPADPALRRYESPLRGFTTGLPIVAEDGPCAWTAHLVRKGHPVPARVSDPLFADDPQRPDAPFHRRPTAYAAEDSDTAVTADAVIDFLRVNHAGSWLLHASFLRPHPPLRVPSPYNAMIDAAALRAPVRAETPEREGATHPWLRWRIEQEQTADGFFEPGFAPHSRTDAELAEARAAYYGLLAECDAQLARILRALRDSGAEDETLLVVTADHGEMLGDHWMWGKGGWFEASNHVPLLIVDPRRPGARRIEAFTESVDVGPTILSWLAEDASALESPSAQRLDARDDAAGGDWLDWDGRSLLSYLEGAPDPEGFREAAVWEYDFRDVAGFAAEDALALGPDQCVMTVRREERWKLVVFADGPPLLYDLERDPNELENRADDPGASQERLRMTEALLAHRMLHAERTLANTLLTPDGVKRYRGPRRSARR